MTNISVIFIIIIMSHMYNIHGAIGHTLVHYCLFSFMLFFFGIIGEGLLNNRENYE